jgi:hypothetical protein
MLLAQVDMFLLELTTDVIAIYFVTRWYIKNRAIDNLNIATAAAAPIATATVIPATAIATIYSATAAT